MNKQNIFTVLGVVLVLIVGIIIGNVSKVVRNTGGANAGTDHYSAESFLAGVTVGGINFATSSVGAVTYTAASLRDVSLITHTAGSALTATLPASSTIDFIPRSGDTRTIYFAPVTTGITLAGGTGTDLHSASSTKLVPVGTVARLDFVRKSNTDIEVLLNLGL